MASGFPPLNSVCKGTSKVGHYKNVRAPRAYQIVNIWRCMTIQILVSRDFRFNGRHSMIRCRRRICICKKNSATRGIS